MQSDLGTAFELADRQRADTGAATGRRLNLGYRASICWAVLHLTLQDQRLIYRTMSVCVCVYLRMSARVSYVFARSPRGARLISTIDIYQG